MTEQNNDANTSEHPNETIEHMEKQSKEAEGLVDRLERANAKREELQKKDDEMLRREENLNVQRQLGGNSEAGHIPATPPEETAEEYSKRIMKGELKDDEGKY